MIRYYGARCSIPRGINRGAVKTGEGSEANAVEWVYGRGDGWIGEGRQGGLGWVCRDTSIGSKDTI